MPDERTDAEIGRDDERPAGEFGPEERDSEQLEQAPSQPFEWHEAKIPDAAPEDWIGSHDTVTDRATDELSGMPRAEDAGIPLPPPEPVRIPGWAPQRTIGGDSDWVAAPVDYGAVPRFEPGTLTPIPVEGGEDGLFAEETALSEEERREAAEAAALRRKQRTKTLVREVVETVLLALLVFLAVRASFQNFKVEGNSMFPTLDDGEFLIVNKLVYSEVDVEKLGRFVPFLDPGDNPKRWVFHGPERGDIVVLQDPRDPSVDLIKRVIGLPGDTFEILQGKIFINGRLLEEPYIKSPWRGSLPEVVIPDGEYFVMGDNRDNSQDSRSLGFVPKDLIIGKTLLAYWPMDVFGLAPNESPTISDKTVADVFGESPPRASAAR